MPQKATFTIVRGYAIGYAYKVDGVIYPVCAYFPIENFDEADEKIKYLISGGKK